MIDTTTQSGLIGALHLRLRSLAAIGACGVMALAGISHAGGSVTMTFEDFLPPAGVLAVPVTPYTEVGFTLDSADSGGTSDGIFAAGVVFNDNGTDIFGWCGGPCFNDPILPIVLTLERTDSMPFAFLSFDASGLFVGDDPGLIEVVGNLVGGGTVSQTIGRVGSWKHGPPATRPATSRSWTWGRTSIRGGRSDGGCTASVQV